MGVERQGGITTKVMISILSRHIVQCLGIVIPGQ